MATITTVDGLAVDVAPDDVTRVSGPRPNDSGPRTYVYGATPQVLMTAEPPDALLARLGIAAAFAVLTRPNGTPVWVKGAAVSRVKGPEPTSPAGTGATVVVGGDRQYVQETPQAAKALINQHGGHL
jgi:hypothetical protein